jgi:hypothetical protein
VLSLSVCTGMSLAMGLVPYVDNFAHCGGFVGGFLLGNVLLVEKAQAREGERAGVGAVDLGLLREDGSSVNGKCCCCECTQQCWRQSCTSFWSLGLLVVVMGTMFYNLYAQVDPTGWCSFCEDINCLETPWWDCNADSLARCTLQSVSGRANATGIPAGYVTLTKLTVGCIDGTVHDLTEGEYDLQQFVESSNATNSGDFDWDLGRLCPEACARPR